MLQMLYCQDCFQNQDVRREVHEVHVGPEVQEPPHDLRGAATEAGGPVERVGYVLVALHWERLGTPEAAQEEISKTIMEAQRETYQGGPYTRYGAKNPGLPAS